MLRKKDTIMLMADSRTQKNTHKHGIEMPANVEHGNELDAKNSNNLRIKAIENEVHGVVIAFGILDEKFPTPVEHKKFTCYLRFNAKTHFVGKVRWGLDGNKNTPPKGSAYARVASREIVRIKLTCSELNGADVFVADTRNACFQVPTSEKHCIVFNP